jgi:HAE1 family hydrophobic/amphiphilic exporter-1
MDLIQLSIKKPVTVIVGVILIVLFGLIGLLRMPYQLSPDVSEPEIAVTTVWPGATPYEIEREIIEEQEEVLKGIPRLIDLESSSFNGQGSITLRFQIGTDVDDALLRVSNKLNEVPEYPENVEKPIINATGAATSPVIWMILRTSGDNPDHVYAYKTYFENEIRQYLERVEGVADLFIGGGTERQMHVVVDPQKLAAYQLTLREVTDVLRAENVNVSAGNLGVGRREYRIRTVAQFDSPEDIGRVVLKSTGQKRIFVSDVARVEFGYEKRVAAMIHNGAPGIAIGVKPEPGANILELTDRVERVVQELNERKIKTEDIYLDWVYDQRPYIRGAIDLVKNDILIGGILAVAVLLIFLRSITATVIVATAIPISIIGTFIIMHAMGRNLNVVSLAGISFAVGILVDTAIVVLENIDRHRKMGKSPYDAAYDGTREVWGAVLNVTISTIAIFLPVVFIEEEAGQLFKDIAIAVSCAVTLSLFVSVSVIPMLSQKLFSLSGEKTSKWDFLAVIGDRIAGLFMGLVALAIKNRVTAVMTVLSLAALSVIITIVLFPKMEYLPQGNRNLVINILIPPPGLSYDERVEIGHNLFDSLKPYFEGDHQGYPGIKNMFYVGADQIMLFGAISTREQRAGELVPLFMDKINSIPGMFGVSSQAGIFQTRLGRGRTSEVDISGDDLGRVIQAAGAMFGMLKQEIPDAQIRPVPSIEVLFPEIRLRPDRDRLRAAGLDSRDFGTAVDILMDGRRIGDFKQEGEKKIDLVLKASDREVLSPEELYGQLLVTAEGDLVPISSLADLVRTTGITEIRHLERRRTITLQVTPPGEMPLERAMEIIDSRIIGAMRDGGMLEGVSVRQSGVADKLTETRNALQWNFLLAAFIMFLIMAALFENFIYPLIIMITVPLGAAGGFLGLKAVNIFGATPQPLDILTMMGFIISIGIVVDNATLIVYQALNNVRDYGMEYKEAILDSTRTRLKPIYMSTATSVFGMLPLVVAPGPGSEIYRGLGSVVVGGLIFSTFFTVFVIPALLIFFIRMEKRGEKPLGRG